MTDHDHARTEDEDGELKSKRTSEPKFKSVETTESFTDPGGTVHTGTIGGGVDDPGNVLGGDASGQYQIALHPSSKATMYAASAVGPGASVRGSNAIGVGAESDVAADYGMSIGTYAACYGFDSISIGDGAHVPSDATESIALGMSAEVSHPNSAAFGTNAVGPAANCARFSWDQIVFGASAGAIPDANLENGEMVVDADEANSQFQLRYKDSSGNIQTGTINFD